MKIHKVHFALKFIASIARVPDKLWPHFGVSFYLHCSKTVKLPIFDARIRCKGIKGRSFHNPAKLLIIFKCSAIRFMNAVKEKILKRQRTP